MENKIKRSADLYYEYLGVNQEMVSRKQSFLKARVALMVALSRYFTEQEIGSEFGFDRSTISFHKTKHASNLASWMGYRYNYEVASKVVKNVYNYEDKSQKIKFIDLEIKKLEKMKSYLIQQQS